jgi:hypothetical protein
MFCYQFALRKACHVLKYIFIVHICQADSDLVPPQ